MTIQPWHWLVFGVVLMIGEMFVPTFALLWFGAAALVVALLTFIVPMSFLAAVIVWLIVSVLFCAAWFKFIKPLSKDRTKAGLGAAVIIGETGLIIKPPFEGGAGLVRFNTPKAGASEWACRSQDGATLQVGDRVVIVDVLGNELLVAKK